MWKQHFLNRSFRTVKVNPHYSKDRVLLFINPYCYDGICNNYFLRFRKDGPEANSKHETSKEVIENKH